MLAAANFVIDQATEAERNQLAQALAKVLKPHLRNPDSKTRARVAHAFCLVASREDSPALEALCDFDLNTDSQCVGFGMAALLRINSLTARSLYVERRQEPRFRDALLEALRACGHEDSVHPLLEIKDVDVFREACGLLLEIGTGRSAETVTRAATGLWPSPMQSEVNSIAKTTAEQLRQRG